MSNVTDNLYIKYDTKKIAIKLSREKDVDHLQFGVIKTLAKKFNLPNGVLLTFVNSKTGEAYTISELIENHLRSNNSQQYFMKVEKAIENSYQAGNLSKAPLSTNDWSKMSMESKLANFAQTSSAVIVTTHENGRSFFNDRILNNIHLSAFFTDISFEHKQIDEISNLLDDYIILLVYVDKELLGLLLISIYYYNPNLLKKRLTDLFSPDRSSLSYEYREFCGRVFQNYGSMLSSQQESALERLTKDNFAYLSLIEKKSLEINNKTTFLLLLLFLLKYFDGTNDKSNCTDLEDISLSRARSRPFSFNYRPEYEAKKANSIKSTTEARKRNAQSSSNPDHRQLIDNNWFIGKDNTLKHAMHDKKINEDSRSKSKKHDLAENQDNKPKKLSISRSNNIISMPHSDQPGACPDQKSQKIDSQFKAVPKEENNKWPNNNVIDWNESISAVPHNEMTPKGRPSSWVNSTDLKEWSKIEVGHNNAEIFGSLGSYSLEKVDFGQMDSDFKIKMQNIEMDDKNKSKRRESENVLNFNHGDKMKGSIKRDKSYSTPLGRISLLERSQTENLKDKDIQRNKDIKDQVKKQTLYGLGDGNDKLVRLSTISPPPQFYSPPDLFGNNLGSNIIKNTQRDSWPSPDGSLVKQLCNKQVSSPKQNISSLKDRTFSNVSEIKNKYSPKKRSHLYKSDADIDETKELQNRFSKFKNGRVFELPKEKSTSNEKAERVEQKDRNNGSSIFFSRKFINHSNEHITDMSMSRDNSQITRRQRNRNYKITTNVSGHRNEQNTRSFCITPDSYRSIFFKKKDEGSTQSKMSMYKRFKYQVFIREEYLRKRAFYKRLEEYVKRQNDDLQKIIKVYKNKRSETSPVDNSSHKSNNISMDDSDMRYIAKNIDYIDIKAIEETIEENKKGLVNFTQLAEAEIYEANRITETEFTAEQSSELVRKIRSLNMFNYQSVDDCMNEYLKIRQKDYECFRTTMLFMLNQQLLPNNVAYYLLNFLYIKYFEPLHGVVELFYMNQDINDFIDSITEIITHVDVNEKLLSCCYMLDFMENTQESILSKVKKYFSDEDNNNLRELHDKGDFGVLEIFGRFAGCKLSFREMLNELRNYIESAKYNFSGIRQADRDILNKIVMLMPIDQKEYYAAQYVIKTLNSFAKASISKIFNGYKLNNKYYEYDFSEL